MTTTTSIAEAPARPQHPDFEMLRASAMNYRAELDDLLWHHRNLAADSAYAEVRAIVWARMDDEWRAMMRARAWRDAAAQWAVCIADNVLGGAVGDSWPAQSAYQACRARESHWDKRAAALRGLLP
jgi:hypothetical protein